MKTISLFSTLSATVFAAGACLTSAVAAEFKIGAHTFTLPDGFNIELVAQSPLVDRPIEADFDEQGRLYVTDSSGSNDKVEKQQIDKPHRVVRLEDTDRDGKFDKTVVFADKLFFPEGCMWLNGSLYVSAPPSIWKLTDTDGDGVADKREEWFKGGTVTGCANDLHGPYAGPDGFIYWNKGAFAKQTHERPGLPPIVTRASHTFRMRPDGTGLETVMTGGMDNPVGLAFTPEGDRFFTCTFIQNPEGGRRDALVHEIYGGVYGKVNDVTDDHPQTGDLMPVTTHLGPAAPCGLMRYESEAMGSAYLNNLFVCQFNLHKISRHILERDGATYKTKDSDFLTAADTDFHPTDILEDADGSILIVDTGGWYKLCCPTSQLAKPDVLGAIYRVRKTDANRLADPRGINIDWQNQTVKQLVGFHSGDRPLGLLSDPRPVVRRRASDVLSRMGKSAVDDLREAFDRSITSDQQLAVVWTLSKMEAGIGIPALRNLIYRRPVDPNQRVLTAIANVVGLQRDASSKKHLLGKLEPEVIDGHRQGLYPLEVSAAVQALGRLKDGSVSSPILKAASELGFQGQMDRTLEHNLAYALIEIGDTNAIRKAMKGLKGSGQKIALIALSQLKDGLQPSDIAPLLSGSGDIHTADLRRTAEWIAAKHPDWGSAFAEIFRSRIQKNPAEAKNLETILTRVAGSGEIQSLLHDLAKETNPEVALPALRVMSRAAGKKAPENWVQVVAQSIASPNLEIAKQAILTTRSFSGQGKDLHSALAEFSNNEKNPEPLRVAAYRSIDSKDGLSPETFRLAINNLNPKAPLEVRSDAVYILTRHPLKSPGQDVELAGAFANVGPMEMTRLFDAFEGHYTEPVGLRLVEALKKSTVIASLPPEIIAQKIAKFPESVQKAAEALPRASQGDAAAQRAHLEELVAAFNGKGDIRRGQAIFNSPKTACITCHSMGYVGGKVGPDLTSIGQVRTAVDLLESIIYPSASFVRSYEPIFVKTKEGESFTGILRGDAPETVTLVTGPNVEERIPRANIVMMQPSAVSIMPAGLEALLTRDELADLVAFLKGTKWGAN